MSTKRKFELVFSGRDNAGLRKLIRDQVSGAWCGPENERQVLALSRRVTLTASGRTKLAAVASDYRAVNGESKATCDCAACVAGSLQVLRAS